jgi:hypothetical protein
MTNVLADYGMYSVNGKIIQEMNIERLLIDLNYATFVYPNTIALGTTITIKYQNTEDVFVGTVTQCRKLARTVSGVTRYYIECVEPAEELQNKYIIDLTENYTALYINNVTKNKTLGQYVSYVVPAYSGWSDISNAEYKNQTVIYGGSTTDSIPGMGFSTCTIWAALQRIVVTIFNYGLWFEYPNGTKCIRYGEYNHDVHEYPTPINVTLQSHNINYNVDGVILYGDDPSFMVTEGDVSPGSRIVVYKYDNCQSTDELKWVAAKIFEDRSVPSSRYEIEFPAGYHQIYEGDRIHIYDTSSGLVYDEDGYGVKDVKITNEHTLVGIGSSKLTIFDLLNDRLSLIDGNILSYEGKDFDTGWTNSYNDVSNDPDTWGVAASADFPIEGQTYMGGCAFIPIFSGSQITGAGYFRIYSAAGYSDDTVTLTPAAPLVANASGVFLDEWFPWTWQWAEVEVSYMSATTNAVGASCSWECEWGDIEIMDRSGLTTISSVQRTVTHKWYVPSYTSMNKTYPLLTCTTDDTSFKIDDITIFITVFYEVGDEYPPITSTMETGEIEMQIYAWNNTTQTRYEATDWFKIYDSSDPDSYNNKEYVLDDHLYDPTAFGTGAHKIYYRLKGTGDAAIRVIGSYSAFDEKTKVIP